MPVTKDVRRSTSGSVHRDQPSPATSAIESPTTQSPAPATPATSASRADADAHLLRLCLGLQLDAMLLTIGAAAAHERKTTSEPADTAPEPVRSDQPTAPPWNRWVNEDMDMVCELAVDIMNRGATLPANLGSELDHAVPAAAVDNLIARYESMSMLLADVRHIVAAESESPYRAEIQSVVTRCESRLNELRASRLEHTPPRGLSLSSLHSEQASLRGEWLG